ncbi:MAG: HAMP domain-containing sensor histidine kinase [Gemmatimonadota bacterium]
MTGLRRFFSSKITRQDMGPIVLLGATIMLVLGSMMSTVRARRANRVMATRALSDFAELAGWSYAFRAHSMFANAAHNLTTALGPVALENGTIPRARVAHLSDSLSRCNCGPTIATLGVGLGRWKDSLSVRYEPAPGASPEAAAPRLSALRRAAMYPVSDDDIAIVTGSDGRQNWAFVITPIHGAKGERGFLAIEADLASLRDGLLKSAFGGGEALMLPKNLVGVNLNRELAELTVTTTAGAELYRSPSAYRTGYQASTRIGGADGLRVLVELSPDAARGILRGAVPARAASVDLALPFLAMLLLCAVALALHRAQLLVRQRSEFAASVTHELRTPLTQILLNAETLELRRARSDAERGAILGAIVRESKRMVYLIENVLHFSRADRRLLRVSPRAVRLDLFVTELVDDLQAIIDATASSVQVRAEMPATARVDADGLRLALTNLVDNALHYAPGGAIVIAVEPHGATVDVVVDDAGPGISPADHARVLRPFERVAASEQLHPTGSGIGLAVVNELTVMMEGEVLLERSPLGGLRVRLRFPAVEALDDVERAT